MINLPRQLIYQDRTELSDYLVGNELNQAIYDALKSIQSGSWWERLFKSSALSDEEILSIFNDAYYLCIIICNDKHFKPYPRLLDEKGISHYAWYVALVVLSLQRHPNENAERHCVYYADSVNQPFLSVLNSFRHKGRNFWMDFAPMVPPAYKFNCGLTMDWEKVTHGFDVDIIKGTLRLWPSYKDKLTVARQMLNVLRKSPRCDMPHLVMSARFLNRLIEMWNYSERNEYVYELWKNHDKEQQEFVKEVSLIPEVPQPAEPEVEEETETTFDEETPIVIEKEKKKKSIFVNIRGEENLDRRTEETNRFMKFIRSKKIDTNKFVIDTSAKNFVNLAFVAFFREWLDRGWVVKSNWVACYRFLHIDCGFSFSVQKKAYGTFIGKMADHEYDIEDELKKITPEVKACFQVGSSVES